MLVAVGVVLWGLDTPLVEDGLFWWVPQGLLAAETGPQWVLDRLAQATRPHAALPPQWADGLPDYGHPPLWFWWMGLSLRVFGPNHFAVHLAALPFAALFGLFLARLGHRREPPARRHRPPADVPHAPGPVGDLDPR